MNLYCDLHTHSHYSDGSYSPDELARAAKSIGLSAIALCDHNTIEGNYELLEAGNRCCVEAIPGIECSTQFFGREVHIVGLFLDVKYNAQVMDRMGAYQNKKTESTKALILRLHDAGFPVTYEAILSESNASCLNRAHIASYLYTKGYVPSIKYAFSELLSVKNGYYIPPLLPDAFETIDFLKSLKCATVFAHPFLNLSGENLDSFLSQASKIGLDAIETLYPKFDTAVTLQCKELAKRFGLLESGGSDFHGEAKPDIQLGVGRGDLKVPVRFLDSLRERAGSRN